MKKNILEKADEISLDYGYSSFKEVPVKLKLQVWREAQKKVGKKSFIRRILGV